MPHHVQTGSAHVEGIIYFLIGELAAAGITVTPVPKTKDQYNAELGKWAGDDGEAYTSDDWPTWPTGSPTTGPATWDLAYSETWGPAYDITSALTDIAYSYPAEVWSEATNYLSTITKNDLNTRIRAVSGITSDAARQTEYTSILNTLNEEAIFLPLTAKRNTAVLSKRLSGFVFGSTEFGTGSVIASLIPDPTVPFPPPPSPPPPSPPPPPPSSPPPPPPSPPPPPPSPPPPPASPGAAYVPVVRHTASLDTTLDAFDATAQASYISQLATVTGVPAANISLAVTAGSITVTATITAATPAAAQTVSSAISTEIASSASASTFLGFTTTATPPAPTVSVVQVAAPPPSPPTSDDNLPGWGGALIGVFSALFALAGIALILLVQREQSGKPLFGVPKTVTVSATSSAGGVEKSSV